MFHRKIILICLSAFIAVLFYSCARVDSGESPKVLQKREVTDGLERPIALPVSVSRVVSLAPSVTENIFAVGAGDRVVGDTTFCNFPEAARSIPKVGDTISPNLERIVALKPDVVFVSAASQLESFTKTLADNGIAVYVTNPTSLDGVLLDLRKMAEVFGTEQTANLLVGELRGRIDDVKQRVRGENGTRVFVQISREPLFTIGKESFLTSLIEQAGGQSVTSSVDTAFPKLSKETALALRPDVIILSDSEDNKGPNDVFKNSPAVKNGRVYRINADILSRPGPRLVDALEEIAKDLHPDKFPQ